MRGSRKNYCWALLQKNIQIDWHCKSEKWKLLMTSLSNQTTGIFGSFWMYIIHYNTHSWRAANKSRWKTLAMSSVWCPFFWVWSRCRTMAVGPCIIIPHNSMICIWFPTRIEFFLSTPSIQHSDFPLCEGKGDSYKLRTPGVRFDLREADSAPAMKSLAHQAYGAQSLDNRVSILQALAIPVATSTHRLSNATIHLL